MLHGFDLLRQQYAKYTNNPGAPSTPQGTVRVLAEKLSDPALTREDRRAAILSLKALSRDHAALVGAEALAPLLEWITKRENDEEMLRPAVEACLALCQIPRAEHAAMEQNDKQQALANMRRTLDVPDGLFAIVTLVLPQHSFYTRFASLQLIGTLLEHYKTETQARIVRAPGGSAAILQCLEAAPTSSTEIIRNETLLLMPSLVAGSPDLQKITAFEGAFERLLDIIAQEGRIEGGVVVQDALEALHALLIDNISNQNYFRETLSIPMLAPLLFYPPPLPPDAPEAATQEFRSQRDAFLLQEWDEQKSLNALLLLRCVRLLVDGHAGGHRENQIALRNAGLTECLVQLAFASLGPPLLKAHTLSLLAAILRSSRQNQDLVSTLVVTPVALTRRTEPGAEPAFELSWQAPQPAMLCLIALALRGPGATESQAMAMAVRTAALGMFEALVAENIEVRMTLLHALVAAPLPEQSHGNSSQMLLESIVHLPSSLVPSGAGRFDSYQYLFAAILFSNLLHSSETTKAFARSIYMDATGRCVAGTAPPTDEDAPAKLIDLIVGNLAMASRELGEAVRRERTAAADAAAKNTSEDWTRVILAYLVLLCDWLWESPASVAEFVSESANLQVILQPVQQAAGVDGAVQALSAFVLGEAYEFNTLDSDQEGVLTRKAMHPILHSRVGPDAFTARLRGLKRDARFADVGPDLLERFILDAEHHSAPPPFWFTWPFVEFWKDNYVRVQKAILVDPAATSASEAASSTELRDARQQIAALHADLQRATQEASLLPSLRAELEAAQAQVAQLSVLEEQLHALQNVQRETQRALDEAQQRLEASGPSQTHDALARELEAASAQAARTSKEHDAMLQAALSRAADAERLAATRAAALDAAHTSVPSDAQLQQENEDLLVLLDDLSLKRKRDKDRMRAHGWEVSEDEDEEE
ncbi:type I protein arginine methyltransferase [Malassezia vespertilionis]|uniref:Uncharacterized protein n=1 Tax=Malassezia vespertilionis TaxID=2020962 RepID=A0A2N1JHC1_9BASI|nr:type I protein arginine methyltransferase [Malassezia vespertilionis]PKI85935.1 hypothetical protein MVES_000164 [Malassezia vespertilionis]WFD04844.1 type I protein arginine methyltransferase [Malassezia vespertilionis]